MSVREFPLPDVGEGLTEAEIVGWRISVGDEITVNQPIVDIETAKAVVELPSPFTGRVTALLVEPGAVVPVGTPILAVEVSDREPVLVGYGVGHEQGRRRRLRGAAAPQLEVTPSVSSGKPMAKPPVRALARELGVDLARIPPTGPHGDITRDDVRRAASGGATVPAPAPVVERPVRGERVPVRSVQRQMAQAMVRSMAACTGVRPVNSSSPRHWARRLPPWCGCPAAQKCARAVRSRTATSRLKSAATTCAPSRKSSVAPNARAWRGSRASIATRPWPCGRRRDRVFRGRGVRRSRAGWA